MFGCGAPVLDDTQGPRARPPFLFTSGKVLTRSTSVINLKKAITKAEVDANSFSGHSFWSGAVTTAAARRITESHIKLLGR